MIYREKKYTNNDIAKMLIEYSESVFDYIYIHQEEFIISFYHNRETILLKFIDYNSFFIFKFQIAHLDEKDVGNVILNIKRKREKKDTTVNMKSLEFKNKVLYDEGNWYNWTSNESKFHMDIRWENATSIGDNYVRFIDKVEHFVNTISKNKKQKLVKFCLMWDKTPSIHNAKSFYKMLTITFGFKLSFQTRYFSKEKANSLGRRYVEEELITSCIEIDTVEHADMVNKSILFEEEKRLKMKELAEKLKYIEKR